MSNGGVTFYMVLEDAAGNTWGSMYATTPENTFVYTIEFAPVMEAVTPVEGVVTLGENQNFILTVDAYDLDLYSLEIDHSFEGTLS